MYVDTIYSGTPLLWTPWGPGEVSCIERCPHFRGRFILRKHIWDIAKCPLYKGVLISGVSFKRGILAVSIDNSVINTYVLTYAVQWAHALSVTVDWVINDQLWCIRLLYGVHKQLGNLQVS